jgi:transposase
MGSLQILAQSPKFIATLRVPGTTYFRTTAEPRQKKAKPPSPRQAAMLLARRPEKLKPAQQQLLAKLNDCCPEIPILYDLAQGFAAVFRDKQADALQTWIDQARGTGLAEMGRFCDGLSRDEKAVNAAVILPWSNGQVEGQIHRLKLVKRQMYGRAKFNLLRRRVLPNVAAVVVVSPQSAP